MCNSSRDRAVEFILLLSKREQLPKRASSLSMELHWSKTPVLLRMFCVLQSQTTGYYETSEKTNHAQIPTQHKCKAHNLWFLGVFCPSGFAICIPRPEHGKSVVFLCQRLSPLWRHAFTLQWHPSSSLWPLQLCVTWCGCVRDPQPKRTRCKTPSSGNNYALLFLPTSKCLHVVARHSLGFPRRISFTYLHLFLVKPQNSGYLSRLKE